MPINLTPDEKNYLDTQSSNPDAGITILLGRLLNRPVAVIEEVATDVSRAVQAYLTGEPEDETDSERTA